MAATLVFEALDTGETLSAKLFYANDTGYKTPVSLTASENRATRYTGSVDLTSLSITSGDTLGVLIVDGDGEPYAGGWATLVDSQECEVRGERYLGSQPATATALSSLVTTIGTPAGDSIADDIANVEGGTGGGGTHYWPTQAEFNRLKGRTIELFTGEFGHSVSVPVVDGNGAAVSLTGLDLQFTIEGPDGTNLQQVTPTKSNNVFTFTSSATVTATERSDLTWSLREFEADVINRVIAYGKINVRKAPQ